MLSAETGTLSDNLTGWSVVHIKERQIKLQLTFGSPLEVSQSADLDQLLIKMNFGSEATDAYLQ